MFALPLRSSNPDFLYGKYAASLFAAGEQGVWYDPSDMSTMFQDAAGTTPVTAMEQPVGLILDKSKGLVLGPELVTNGDFSNGTTGWGTMSGATIVVVNGELEVTGYSTECFARARQYISVIPGRTYLIRATARKGTAGPNPYLSPIVGTDYSTASITNVTIGGYYVAQNSTIDLQVGLYGCGSGTVYFDNISVREVPGNHARQTTTASRPVLSARYNLLTKTEQFNDVYWIKTGTTAQANVIQEALVSSRHSVESPTIFPAGIALRLSVEARPGSSNLIQMTFVGAPSAFANFDLVNGVVTTSGDASGGSGLISASIQQSTDGYYRCTLVAVLTYSGMYSACISLINDNPTASRNPSYLGTGKYVFVRNIDVRVANDAAGRPVYQRVNTATDYDTQGFPHYLRFDGVDDWLVTPPIDFTATDKMTVFTGVRKLSDTISILCELGTNWTIRNGFYLASQLYAGVPYYTFGPRGNRGAVVNDETNVSTSTAPDSAVITSQVSMNAGTPAQIRRNAGSFQDSINTSFGGGNFGNHPVYIGRRNGTEYPFNGRLYGLILRGAQTGTTDLTNVERYLAYKSGVVL